jgi:chaperonin GroEL
LGLIGARPLTGPDEGFDALSGRRGNMIDMGIVDPLRVVLSALANGASVDGLLGLGSSVG